MEEHQKLFSVTKQDIVDILQETLESQHRQLSEEEIRYIRLAIRAEAEKLAFRKAVIEKTITSLIWAAIVLAGTAFYHVVREWLITHGYKP